MKISRSTVEKIVITDAQSPEGLGKLDPITVIAEDFGPGQGKITITCYGDAWSCYWGSMGEKTKLAEFFCGCDEHYLAGKLKTGIDDKIDDDDEEAMSRVLRAKIIKRRRKERFTKEEARDLYDKTAYYNHHHDGTDLLYEVLGDEWWYLTPKKPNPQYEYLCRIINAVKAAFSSNDIDQLHVQKG